MDKTLKLTVKQKDWLESMHGSGIIQFNAHTAGNGYLVRVKMKVPSGEERKFLAALMEEMEDK